MKPVTIRSVGMRSGFATGVMLLVTIAVGTACPNNQDTIVDGDTTAPSVQSVAPANGSQGVPKTTPISATFSEPIDPATVTTTTFTVTSPGGAVTGTVSTSGAVATFTPAAPLSTGGTYTATIKGGATGVADAAGNRLAADFAWLFKVNVSPIASAGADQDVNQTEVVTLNGSATDADGQPLTYTWTQVSGPSVGPLTGATPSFTAPNDVLTLEFDLVVSDGQDQSAPDRVVVWVLENKANAVWVSPTGNDANPGTRALPMATIQAAIARADAAGGGADIYVAGGTYNGSVSPHTGGSLYGGWNATTWLRDIASNETMISGGTTAVTANAAGSLRMDGFTIVSARATAPGGSSFGVLANNSNLVISRNRITAGAGADGLPGRSGRTGSPGWPGEDGTAGAECPTPPQLRPGGVGGNNPLWGDFAGGAGGAGTPAEGKPGLPGEGSAGGPAGGAGGAGGALGGGDGQPGERGSAIEGSHGTSGTDFGTIGLGGYVPSSGTNGSGGSNGSGGGGGGGGGGVIPPDAPPRCGGGGGGGGSGGERGGHGEGGGGGGASFGIVVTGGSNVTIQDNSITTGAGGRGGDGGAEGLGGPGGLGGVGGANAGPGTNTGAGGNGGPGASGGAGGSGGGGGGGPTVCIVEDQTSRTSQAGNACSLGAAGVGGEHGAGPPPPHRPGAPGRRVEYLKL